MSCGPSGEVEVHSNGVLGQLRLMRPARRLTRSEARRVAERQAAKLLRLRGSLELPMPEEVITHLPRIRVYREPLGSLSGVSHWEGSFWRIGVNAHHALVRQRFTIAHEFAHILDAPFDRYVRPDHAEAVADYFAACLLMPRQLVKKLWGHGIQDTRTLAAHFNVSTAAMRWRLDELRLGDLADLPLSKRRCGVVSEQKLQTLIGERGGHEYQFAG